MYDLGVPLAFVKPLARVGSPSGLGLALGPPRPYAASTRPGPGGIPLWRDLRSPLTRGRANLFSQAKVFAPGGILRTNLHLLSQVPLSTSNRQLSTLFLGAPKEESDRVAK